MDSYQILIGVCDRGRFFRYAAAVEMAGFCPVFVPEAYDALNRKLQGRLMRCAYADRRFCLACAERFDGLLLPGGGDIHPAHFDQIDRYSAGIEVQLDRMQFYMAEAFAAAEKPIFGICKGMQLLNVLFGGDLYQELPPEQKVRHAYDREQDKDRLHGSWFSREFLPAVWMEAAIPAQNVMGMETDLQEGGKSSCLCQEGEQSGIFLRVNSAHHQAVRRLGDGFQVIQWAEDGVVEGIFHKNLPIAGLQWHPERCDTEGAKLLFRFIWKELFDQQP